MQENQGQEGSKSYIIPEWKRSKDAIIDSYLLTINSMSEVLPRFYTSNQLPQSLLNNWKKGIIALFFQIREHESELLKIESVKDHISDMDKLQKFTNKILETKTLKDIKAISRKKDHDPIVEYKKEAYK
jgi:hypothetical protein